MAITYTESIREDSVGIYPSAELADGTTVTNYIIQLVMDLVGTDDDSGATASHPLTVRLTAPEDKSSADYIPFEDLTEIPQFAIDACAAAGQDEDLRAFLAMQIATIIDQPVSSQWPWMTQPDPPVDE
jgi:hypothetical protein